MKTFEPVNVEDLAVHNKKVQEVEEWVKTVSNNNNSDILLMTGPVGCGKTIALRVLATKYNVRISEWITPVDIDIPSEYGNFQFFNFIYQFQEWSMLYTTVSNYSQKVKSTYQFNICCYVLQGNLNLNKSSLFDSWILY